MTASFFQIDPGMSHLQKKALILAFFLISFSTSYATYSVNSTSFTWCTSSYPTSYTTGSWSIDESSTNGMSGFSKNQSNKTFIIDLPAGFEFKTTGTTATVTIGPSGIGGALDFSACTFVFTSTTRITVTASTNNQELESNTMYFNNFEIRATAVASGNMVRNGGTFKCDNNTGNPTSSEPLATLSAQSPFVYSSTIVTQDNNGTNINQYSVNNRILKIKINGSGTCNGTVTQFDLNTLGNAGTDLASNISTAVIYYTGSTTTFATTNQFGTLASPNGSFSITGSQALANGDNYFWLTYDVPGNANTDAGTPLNRLDAQLVDFVLNGSTINSGFITPNPEGSRPIVGAAFYYSIQSGTWNNSTTRWSTTSGGTTCSCQPNGSGVAIIQHAITLDANRTVDVVQIDNGGSLTHNGSNKSLTVNSSLNTFGSGYFDLRSAPLNILGNVTLSGTGTCTNNDAIDVNGNLTVGTGTTFQATTNNKHITIGGDLTLNGTLQHTAPTGNITMDGGNLTIDGTGTISNAQTFIINSGNKTILSTANLTINCPVQIQGANTITNYGTVTLTSTLDGNNAASQWTNGVSSVLKYSNTVSPFNTNGIFDASANFNTVYYNGAGNQTIVRSNNSGQYYHLNLAVGGTKTLTQSIRIGGDFTNTPTLNSNGQNVTFNGTVAQNIIGPSTCTFNNLIINNTSGAGVTLFSAPVIVTGALTLTQGVLYTDATNILTMNAGSTSDPGSAASFVDGPMNKVGNTAFVFPVGDGTKWARVAIGAPSATTTFKAQYIATPYTNTTTMATTPSPVLKRVSNNEYWQLDRTVGTGNATVTLYWEDAAFSGINNCGAGTTLRVAHWNGAAWENNNNAVTTTGTCGTSGTISTVTNVTSFSPFTFGSDTSDISINPLPIELLSFDAQPNGNIVDLTWTTASEINNDFFTIEKTIDGIHFETVGIVNGAGNSTNIIHYSSQDNLPYIGVAYYRLKQTDFDGNFSYSDLKMVKFEGEKDFSFNIYPNPNDGVIFNLQIHANNNEQVLVIVYDVLGNEIYSKIIISNENDNNIYAIDPSQKLPAGVYMVSATSNDSILNKRLIVN